MKDVFVIGGPNGAGKTTAAGVLIPGHLGIREFVNADEIARGISPFNPEGSAIAAGKLMLQRIGELMRRGESFAIETTCAGRSHVRLLSECRDHGYRLTLIFLWLPSAEHALARVARRVREGGHRIPDDIVVRRYAAGLRNMRDLYLPLADVAAIYDNSDRAPKLVAERTRGNPLAIYDVTIWSLIERAVRCRI